MASLGAFPWWLFALFLVMLGIGAGFALSRRREERRVGLALIAAAAILVGVGSSVRWDFATRRGWIGGQADTEKVLAMEALSSAEIYLAQRRAWISMTPGERWRWRLTKFLVTAGSLTAGALPTFLVLTRRPR